MKSTSFFTLVSFGVALVASQVQAQLMQPTAAQPASLHYTYYAQDTAPSPSDVPPPPGVNGEAPSVEQVMQDEAEYAEVAECEEEDGPVRLFHSGGCIDIYGHVSGGFYQNGSGNSSSTGNAPIPFRQISDGATLDQFWITAEKTLDDCCPSWGFRIDYIFGVDGPDTQAFGDQSRLDYRFVSSRDYGSAIPQMYAQYGTTDCNIKVGHFFTLIGYEVVSDPGNFFYSHAYTMNYGEPFTHTGALVEKHLMCDQLTVWAGWTNGWDSYFENYLDGSTFLGGASYSVCDDLTVTYAVNAGYFGDGTPRRAALAGAGNQGNIFIQSIVIDYQINECMEYVFQSDYGNNELPNGQNLEWYGVNQYLFYTLSSCHKLGARLEWFNDADNARVGVNSNNNDVNYYALSLGLNYTPNSNVIIRPEVRYDRSYGGRAYNDQTDLDEIFYGMDFIVLY